MVLLLKQWKSRSSPGFAGGADKRPIRSVENAADEPISRRRFCFERESVPDVGAGWSSPVARQAHNLKVAGSNPAPATNKTARSHAGFFVASAKAGAGLSIIVRPLAVIGDIQPLPLRVACMP